MSQIKKCDQPNCQVEKTGKCINGVIETCTYFYLAEESEKHEAIEVKTKLEKKDLVALYSGKEMGVEDVLPITNQYTPKWIVIVGDSDCGKTTLIATIFDLFQFGPYGDFLFAGSRSQVGFEIRCFDSRVESGHEEPKTKKTNTKEEFKFLHLRLKEKANIESKGKHLLLSDIPGEVYTRARNLSTEMKNLDLLNRADSILFIIDGEKLSSDFTKDLAITHARAFLNKALDEKKIGVHSKLKIVVSKWDKLYDKGIDIENLITKPFTQEFGQKLKNLEFDVIASRPDSTDSKIEWGYGLDKLLKEWYKDDDDRALALENTFINTNRSFHNYRKND